MRAALLTAALVTMAQVPPPAGPAFEVATIKPNPSRETAYRIIWPRGRFSAVNVTVRHLVEAAYVLPPFRIDGGPGWLGADRFNVEATVSADAIVTPAQPGLPEAV